MKNREINGRGDAMSTPTIAENTPEKSDGAAVITPTPIAITGEPVVFKGENAEIIIKEDLRTSLENQEHPKIWFEYKDQNENLVKKELPDEISKIIKTNWKTRLTYLYHKHITDDKNAIYESTFSDRMEAINSLNNLRELETDLLENRKKFIDDEIWQLLRTQMELALERFEELAKHFDQ